MSDYSLDLNEDQIQITKWVHEFAENVVRPAGPEWDEREETPWPVIEEAAKIGLYSFDFIAQAFSDPTGLLMCLVNEEMSWGDAGIALAIFGSTLAVAGIFANGTPEQIGEWIPQCFGTPDDIKLAAFGVSEPDAGSDVSSLKSRAVYDEAKDEWVLNGTKTWITNGGIANTHVLVLSVDPTLGSRGQAELRRARGHARDFTGPEVQEDGHPRLAHGRGHPRRLPGAGALPAWGQGEARRAHGPGQGRQADVDPGRHGHLRGVATDCGRAGRRHRPGRLRVLARLRQGAQAVRPGHHREPGHRVQAGRHEDAHRRRPVSLVHRAAWMASTGKKFENGEGSMSKLYAGENAVWVTEQAIQILGGYGYVRENPVEQWHRDSKIYTIFEGTSEVQRLVISRAISGIHIN